MYSQWDVFVGGIGKQEKNNKGYKQTITIIASYLISEILFLLTFLFNITSMFFYAMFCEVKSNRECYPWNAFFCFFVGFCFLIRR